MKKLYDVPNNSRIGVLHLGLKYEESGERIEELDFYHVDGMYSYCKDDKGNVIHLSCTSEVEILHSLDKK